MSKVEKSPRPGGGPWAYFLTFACYGTRIHGSEKGSVDRNHNAFGCPFLPANRERVRAERGRMCESSARLDKRARSIALEAIRDACAFRGWILHAAHVRSNHVHVVVAAPASPSALLQKLKTRISRALNDEFGKRSWWARHGSTIPLWNAQPVVNPGGVVNTASFTPDGLPNSGIAQGSFFAVFGQNLGPGNLVPNAELPLPTELAGTSMEVTVNGTVVTPFLFFTFSGQLAGVLPSNTPLGQGTLTVTFNGETSEPVAIEVVKSAFGMFTRNRAGFGPAIVQNFVSPTDVPTNALTAAAAPGQAEILWGSGLGPITESDADLPPVGNLPVEVEVLVGGISVTPFYAGRSSEFPAVDQINFFVPAGIEGCYVPLAVKVDGVVSNYGTMAVASEGTICSDPTSFSAADLQAALGRGGARIGTIEITRLRGMIAFPEAGLFDVVISDGEGAFGRFSLARLWSLNGPSFAPVPALGTCVAYGRPAPEGFEILPEDLALTFARRMDAGAALNLTGPLGTKELEPDDCCPGLRYENELDRLRVPGEDDIPEFVVPGLYTVDNGGGGSEVGPFQASLNFPTSLTWSNRDSIPDRIPRSEDVTVTWTGGDPDTQFVVILGHSMPAVPPEVEGSFVCTERVEAGRFTVPAVVLSSLPVTREWTGEEESPTGSSIVATKTTVGAARFTAPGIHWGYFTYLDLEVNLGIRYE